MFSFYFEHIHTDNQPFVFCLTHLSASDSFITRGLIVAQLDLVQSSQAPLSILEFALLALALSCLHMEGQGAARKDPYVKSEKATESRPPPGHHIMSIESSCLGQI